MEFFSPAAKQTWAVSSILLGILAQGMLMGHASCLYSALLGPNSDIEADKAAVTWIVSSVGMLIMLGVVIASLLMDWCGRKTAFLVTSIPAILGWVVTYFAKTVHMLTAGRILGGMTCGSIAVLGAIITGEFTSPKYRGMFLNLKTASVCLGSTLVHGLGNFFHWRTLALVALVINIISFLIACTWPESPAWLASKNQFERCKQAFLWLRGNSQLSQWEADELIKAQREVLKINNEKKSNEISRRKILNFFNKFTKRDFVQPVFIIFLAGLLLEASGRFVYLAYSAQILQEITETETQTSYYMLFIDLIITTSVTCSSLLVRIVKRRSLLFFSAIPALIVLALVCVYLYLVDVGILSKGRSWVSVCLFIVYFILANLGCTPIPIAWCGEVFPLAHRGSGSMVAGILFNLGLIVFLKYTPYLLQSLKVYGTFAIFGFIMGVTLMLLYFFVPETKERTLQEIEEYFKEGRFKHDGVRNDDEARMRMVDP